MVSWGAFGERRAEALEWHPLLVVTREHLLPRGSYRSQ